MARVIAVPTPLRPSPAQEYPHAPPKKATMPVTSVLTACWLAAVSRQRGAGVHLSVAQHLPPALKVALRHLLQQKYGCYACTAHSKLISIRPLLIFHIYILLLLHITFDSVHASFSSSLHLPRTSRDRLSQGTAIGPRLPNKLHG